MLRVMSKWRQWQILVQDPHLQPHLPETAPLAVDSLTRFLDRYGGVYVKPDHGGRGRGVSRVRYEDAAYSLHCEAWAPVAGLTLDEIYQRLRQAVGSRTPCIVQQEVRLPHIQGRPFDLRVMLQRGTGGKWIHTGTLAKVAGPGSAVTNVARSRGQVMPADVALAAGTGRDPAFVEAVLQHLAVLGLAAIQTLAQAGVKTYEAGMDAAVTADGFPWILEVNEVRPSHSLFRHLPDRDEYRRVQRTTGAFWYWRLARLLGLQADGGDGK